VHAVDNLVSPAGCPAGGALTVGGTMVSVAGAAVPLTVGLLPLYAASGPACAGRLQRRGLHHHPQSWSSFYLS